MRLIRLASGEPQGIISAERNITVRTRLEWQSSSSGANPPT
jgi:hypothetical protein